MIALISGTGVGFTLGFVGIVFIALWVWWPARLKPPPHQDEYEVPWEHRSNGKVPEWAWPARTFHYDDEEER